MVLQNSTLLLKFRSKIKQVLSESLVAEDRHYSRYYLAVYSYGSAIFDPLVEEFIVIEELCNDEVCAGIDLLFEEADVILTTLSF